LRGLKRPSFYCLIHFYKRRRMGNAGGWRIGHKERTNMKCYNCNIRVDNLERADHILEHTSHKTYIFWHNSASTTTYTVSNSFGQGGGSSGGSTSITEGSPLVKMFRRDGYSHVCALCFSKIDPAIWKDVIATLYGRKSIINVADMTLVSPEIGSF